MSEINKDAAIIMENILEEFEYHWGEMCKKFETTEMSKCDAKKWNFDFSMDRLKFLMKMDTFIRRKYGNEIDTRLDRIEHRVGVAILKSRSNFREKEKIRLREFYAIFGVLLYHLLKIIGKL